MTAKSSLVFGDELDTYVFDVELLPKKRPAWDRLETGKPQFFFGGCNFRKGNNLRFCRESVSQCGGQGFFPIPYHRVPATFCYFCPRIGHLEMVQYLNDEVEIL